MAFPNNPTSPPVLELNDHAINTSCVGFWPLTQVSGTTATDVSTGGNDGTLGTGVTWGTGSVGANAEFPSTLAGRVDTTLDLTGYSAVTVSAWVRNDGGTVGDAFGKIVSQSHGGNFDTFMRKSNQSLTLDINSTTVAANDADIPATGTWFHVCFVWEQSVTQAVYINGGLSGSGTADTSVIGATTHDVFIGGTSAATRPWDGGIQNVRVFNTALSADDVELLYNRPWVGTDYDEKWPYSPPVPSSMSVNTDALMTDCVAWWPLTEGTGTVATDIVGSNNGAESGTVGWDDTTLGNSPDFDGTDDRFEVDDAGDFDFGTGDFSVSAWVYFDSTPGSVFQFVSRGDTVLGSACWFALSKTALNVFNFIVDDNVLKREAKGSTTVASGTWYHVVGVRNSGGTNRLYVNGVSEGNTADNGNSVSQSDAAYRKLRISSITNNGTYNEHHDGNIQNVRIWNRALSADEVTLLYERPWEGESTYGDVFPNDPPPTLALDSGAAINTNLEGWWPLLETDDYASGAADISGNSNTMTNVNSVISYPSSLGASAYFGTGGSRFELASPGIALSTGFTVSAWARFDTASSVQSDVVGADGGTGERNFQLKRESSGVSQFAVFESTATSAIVLSGNKTLDAGNWYHMVGTYDSSNGLVIYVDGVQDATDASTHATMFTLDDAVDELDIGSVNRGSDYHEGNIQNVRIWSRALSATEVQSLYETPWIGSNYGAAAVFSNYIYRSKRFRRL